MENKKEKSGCFRDIFIVAAIAIVVVAGYTGCSYINKQLGLSDDNAIEEKMESIVETKLMLPEGSIDFTPGTKEKRRK